MGSRYRSCQSSDRARLVQANVGWHGGSYSNLRVFLCIWAPFLGVAMFMMSLESEGSEYFLIALMEIPVCVVAVCPPNLNVTEIQDLKQGFLSLGSEWNEWTTSVDIFMQPELAPGVLDSLECKCVWGIFYQHWIAGSQVDMPPSSGPVSLNTVWHIPGAEDTGSTLQWPHDSCLSSTLCRGPSPR